MTVAYRWTCKFCGTANAPASSCAKCNFPVEATAVEFEMANASGSTAVVYEKRESDRRAKEEWRALPIWKKVVFGISMGLVFIVVGIIKYSWLILSMFFGWGVALAGVAAIWIASVAFSARK